jgi:transcriptional regulator with XRE-family HTH domain
VRESVGITQGGVASKAGVKRQSYAQFETAEERGTISLSSLRRAAEAMDCEFIYFVVPRAAVAATFTELAKAHDPMAGQLRATEHSMTLKGEGAADDAH